MDGAFLEETQCYFGGGTRIALDLGEYRESEDIDFLCSSRDGYRALRSTITDVSLGAILSSPLALAREVRADRCGIRTFLDVGGGKVKFEIVNEGRIEIRGERCIGLPVPCLDRVSCVAEKFLANSDCGNDEAALGRDVIDLAFMVEAWGDETVRQGSALARGAYGGVVDRAATTAAKGLLGKKEFLKRCVTALGIAGQKTLRAGLERLAKTHWN